MKNFQELSEHVKTDATRRTIAVVWAVDTHTQEAVAEVMKITGGRGVDCAMEAVGYPATFDICQKIIKEGGRLANVGVHGQPVNFEIEKLWIKNLKITTGLVNANTTEMLMKAISTSSVDYTKMLTHHFKFSELEQAYDVFKHAAENQAMKVVLTAD